MKQRRVLLGAVALLVLLAVAVPPLYRAHVEAEFRSFLRVGAGEGEPQVKESRCLGRPAARIRLTPILHSKLRGAYPYLDEIDDPKGRDYMRSAYFHGYWFNYCKLVRIGEQDLIAYWSVKEDRWHLGQLTVANGKAVWEEHATEAQGAAYTGSVGCRSCHEGFYQKWSNSWHGLAMQPYTPAFARANLIPQTNNIEIRGRVYRAEIGQEPAVVRETGPEGEKSHPIAHVLGGKNVYYFLTPWPGGRLQVLPVAFDVRAREWYDTAGSMVRHFHDATDEALDWTERPLSFNTSCYNCHVSQLSKSYSIETDSYSMTWGEPGINCEVCHGPGKKHVQTMLATGDKKPARLDIIVTSDFSPAQVNSMCAPCHAKMMPLTTNFMPGDEFFDHFNITTLEDRDFHPDGRDLGENFTYTLWRMSPCVTSGQLQCMHCHTSSGRNRHVGADADRACLPCHEPLVKDPVAHSHHKPDSAGSRCVACHMPMTTFARMRRHDHTMLPPTPAATLEFQSPNACNLCHTDQDAKWSEDWVRKWYPRDYQAPLLHRARLIAAARREDWTRLADMVDYVAQTNHNEIFAASLLRLLEPCPDPAKWSAYRKGLQDASPLVRAGAAFGLGGCPDPAATPALIAATADPCRVVRIQAASALTRRGAEPRDDPGGAQVEKAMAELEQSLRCQPDVALSHYNLGSYHQARGNASAALAEYELASRMYPSFLPARVNVSLIHAAQGQPQLAEQALREALRISPTNAAANFNLGLLLAEHNRLREAEDCFRTALRADPKFAAAAYNLGVLLAQTKPEETLALCQRAAELEPHEAKYAYTLAFYLNGQGDPVAAEHTLTTLLKAHPQHNDALALLGAIYEQNGRSEQALALYKKAVEDAMLPEAVRLQFAMRIAHLEGR